MTSKMEILQEKNNVNAFNKVKNLQTNMLDYNMKLAASLGYHLERNMVYASLALRGNIQVLSTKGCVCSST